MDPSYRSRPVSTDKQNKLKARLPRGLEDRGPAAIAATRQMVENMLGKLGGHSMFAGGTRRLQMCGDCRVVDMMENKAEAQITDVPK